METKKAEVVLHSIISLLTLLLRRRAKKGRNNVSHIQINIQLRSI